MLIMKNDYSISTKNKFARKLVRNTFLVCFLFWGTILFSQVAITRPNLSISVCSGFPSTYFPLGNIVITETNNANIGAGTNITQIFTAPNNFQFLAGTGTVTFQAGRNVSAASIVVTATTITLTYSSSNTNRPDIITISGIQVRAINIPTSGDIFRSGGTGVINGIINGTTLTNTITSIVGTAPTTANAGANQNLTCATTTTVTGNTPTVGTGSWSLVSGTATITSPSSPTTTITGLTIGGSATLRWTITNSPCSASTSDVTITSSFGASCYCAPTYTNGPGTIDQITNVTLGNLNNTSGASIAPFYTFYNTVTIPNLVQSTTASVSVSFGSDANQWAAVWIDFNQNGVFEATEGVVSTVNAGANGTAILTINVPAGALTGNTRMRVRGGNDSILTTAQACGASSSGFGETEDYIVNIVAITPCTTPNQATALVLTPDSTAIFGGFTAAAPAPNNYLVVVSTSNIAPSPINATSYAIGATIGAGYTVIDNDANTNFSTSPTLTLTPSTLYYIYIFSNNSLLCSGGPTYNLVNPLTGTTTTLAPGYCIPTGNLDCSTSNDNIANVTMNTLNNSSTCSPTGYINFAPTGTQTTTLTRGNAYNLSVRTGVGNRRHGLAAWIDFNQNLVFEASEYFFFGNGVNGNTTNTITVLVPAGAALGNTRMRVRYGRQTNVNSGSSCTMTGTRGETEDYTITIINPIPCVAPTAQPTVLILNPTNTSITGNFTAPSPVPNNYLVVISTSSTAPTPINTTSYPIGATIGAGYTVVDNDSNTTFVASSLLPSTTYFVYIFSYNSACSGGPIYNVVNPLTGTTPTLGAAYCIPSVSAGWETATYFSEVSFVGTLNDFTNSSTFSTNPRGYQDFTGLPNIASQAQGEGVNISIQTPFLSYVKAWVDWNKDGDFVDAGEEVYNTGVYSIISTTFGFIIPAATPVGNYRIRLRLNDSLSGTNTFNSCGNINNSWGESEDYLFTVVASCSATIATVTENRTCGPGSVTLNATSNSVGVSQYRWYTTPTGSTQVGSTGIGSWSTPSISTTTTYYVTAFNGCESLVRTAVNAIVDAIPSLTYSPTSPIVCGEDVVLTLNATGDREEVYLINENFNSGLGTFTNTNILNTAPSLPLTQWQNRTSTFKPNNAVWFPAISSGVNGNNFAYSTSDISATTVHNQLASASVNTTNFTNLTLSMRLFYSHYDLDGANAANDYVTIDVFNGTSWIEIRRYIEDVGIGTRFETLNFDLSAYVNIPNLQVRVRYYAYWSDGLAVDDIKLYGFRPIASALSWTSATTVDAFTNFACTIPYVAGTPALNIYVKPTAIQLESGSFSFTANATLANGCATSQLISVTNNSKLWQGLSSDWNDSNNWKPAGVPNSNNCIIIPDMTFDPIISGTSYDAFGKNITVKTGGNITVNSSNNITVNDEVVVKPGATFDIKNNASLIQTNDTALNSGNILMTRTSRPMTRWGYVYWSSPVAENVFSQIPASFDFSFRWNSGTLDGSWSWLASTTSGEGFISRVRNIAPFSTGVGTIDFPFIGTPKNGVVNINVDSYDNSSLVSGNTVLLGNPYPSAIDGSSFLTHPNNTELGGTLFFWTSVTLYSGSGLYNVLDYGSWNLSGGVGTSPASDPTNTSLKPNGKIAAGQGFFAQVFADGSINFNNSMRIADFNNQFFRTSNQLTSISDDNRVWLNLFSDTTFRQMMVNYKAEATNGFDRLYDGTTFTSNEINIYSILNDKNLVIQGRGLPFDDNDIIPLGIKITYPGIYSIAIDEVDGLFSDYENIIIKDNYLNTEHKLTDGIYNFATADGTFNDRFELVFRQTPLSIINQDSTSTFAMIKDHILHIQSNQDIQEVQLFDLTGKLIKTYSEIEQKNITDSFLNPNGVYLAKIKLTNGAHVTKKLIH